MTRRPSTLVSVLAAALASLALATGCSSDNGRGAGADTGSEATSRLADLSTIDDLRAAFNAEPDVPRLILLLSPT